MNIGGIKFGKGGPNLDPGKIIGKVKDVANQGVKQVENVAKQGVKQVEGAAKQGVKEVESAAKKGLGELAGEIESLVAQALLALASEATKPALVLAAKMARTTARVINPVLKKHPADAKTLNGVPFVLPITLGVVSLGLYWNGVFGGERLNKVANNLDAYAKRGIGTKRHEIIQFVKDLGPDTVDLGVGVQVSLGIQVGITPSVWSLPTKYFLILADEAMKEAGVPS